MRLSALSFCCEILAVLLFDNIFSPRGNKKTTRLHFRQQHRIAPFLFQGQLMEE